MDKRLIDKILNYDNDQLLRLEAFTYSNKNNPKQRTVGLISQEMQVIEPLLIRPTAEGYLTIDYQGFTVALFDVVKKQQAQIDELKREITGLKSKKK